MSKDHDNTTDTSTNRGAFIRTQFEKLNLLGMISLVMLTSLLLVGISYLSYLNSDQSKYDLARPGSGRSRVLSNEDEVVDTTSPVSAEDVTKKLESLDKDLKALGGYNTFGPEDLSDQNLGLSAREQPSL